MNNFVRIVSLFTNPSERNIPFLSKRYHDSEHLLSVISELTGDILTPCLIKGKKILLKPNWVKHDSQPQDEICLRTHDQFLLAALETILTLKPCSVTIGDAPIQGCHWERMITADFIASVNNLSKSTGIQVIIKDFRRTTFDPSLNNPVRERAPLKDYVLFDLGKKSWLEEVSSDTKSLFRVTDYNPDLLAKSHRAGIHRYCITRELFDADVVISLPKVKTHQKAGITAALKNIVGLNGDKDFLPHHRLGGTGFGGDCYPGHNYFRYWAELILDKANRQQGKAGYLLWKKISAALWKSSLPDNRHHLAAGWYGNDTTWRMVLDLNKIVLFGKQDGSLADKPQRQLFSLCDGITGGQGDGPLKPEPLPLGVISFTNNSGMNDVAMATLMGFNPKHIPLLNKMIEIPGNVETNFIWNNHMTDLKSLKEYKTVTKPPSGWLDNHLLIS